MTAFLIVSTIAGAILGLRFKVFVLGPATLLDTAVVALTGIGNGYEATSIALVVLSTVASLQIGYFGCGILYATVLTHLPARAKIRPSPPQIGAGKFLN